MLPKPGAQSTPRTFFPAFHKEIIMPSRRVFLIVCTLVLAALACNFVSGSGTEETASPGESPTDSAESSDAATPDSAAVPPADSSADPTATAGPSGDAAPGEPGTTLDLDNPALYAQPDLFNTYRTSFYHHFDAEGSITGTVNLDSSTRVAPYETTMAFETSGTAVFGGGGTFTYTQIADVQYVVSPSLGCQSGAPGMQPNPFEAGLDSGGMLTGLAEYAGEESVNGVDTYRYTITMDNIDPLDPAGKDVRSIANGSLNVAQQGGYAVRLILEGRGVSEVLTQDPNLEGDIYYEINYYDFDQPVTIAVPAACSAAATDFPMPDDAANVSEFGGIISFSTGLSMDETQDFFEDALPGYGCSEPQVFGDASIGISIAVENCSFGAAQILLSTDGSATLVSAFLTP